MLSRGEESKFLHRLCRHHFFFEVVPVRNSYDEEAVSVYVCFCTAQGKAVAVFLANLLMMVQEVKSDLLVSPPAAWQMQANHLVYYPFLYILQPACQ